MKVFDRLSTVTSSGEQPVRVEQVKLASGVGCMQMKRVVVSGPQLLPTTRST